MFDCPICGERVYNSDTRTIRNRITGEVIMMKRTRLCKTHTWHRLYTVEIPEDEYTRLTTPKPGGEWIPVEKRPPDKIGYVFGIWKASYKPEGYEIGRIKYLGLSAKRTPKWLNHKKVTHWLPMPEELPEEWEEKE